MSDAPTPFGEKPSRWMRVFLFVSVALNLLVVGLIIGAFVTGGPGGRKGDRISGPRDVGALPFLMALEPRDRREIIRSARRDAEAFRQSRQSIRQGFEDILEALRGDEFDPKTFAALLENQRGAVLDRQAAGERVLVTHLSTLTVTERRDYADRLEQSLRRALR